MDEKIVGLWNPSVPYEEAYQELSGRMRTVHLSRVAEMPRLELYMDQVLTFVSEELSFLALPGETLVTAAMVNNYVKQGLVPAPAKKRYTRRHLASLVYVCAFKRAFSIAQVGSLERLATTVGADKAQVYDELASALESSLAASFPEHLGLSELPAVPAPSSPSASVPTSALLTGEAGRIMAAGVIAVANVVYVEQMLVLSERFGGTASS